MIALHLQVMTFLVCVILAYRGHSSREDSRRHEASTFWLAPCPRIIC